MRCGADAAAMARYDDRVEHDSTAPSPIDARRAQDAWALGALLLDEAAPLNERRRALDALAGAHGGDAEHALHTLLEHGADATLVVPALETLCVRWGLAARYAAMLRHFVRGVRWDIDAGGDVRRAAIGIAGAYLASASDTELMFDLIRISEQEPDEAARTAAVRALARATGYHGRPVDLRFDG